MTNKNKPTTTNNQNNDFPISSTNTKDKKYPFSTIEKLTGKKVVFETEKEQKQFINNESKNLIFDYKTKLSFLSYSIKSGNCNNIETRQKIVNIIYEIFENLKGFKKNKKSYYSNFRDNINTFNNTDIINKLSELKKDIENTHHKNNCTVISETQKDYIDIAIRFLIENDKIEKKGDYFLIKDRYIEYQLYNLFKDFLKPKLIKWADFAENFINCCGKHFNQSIMRNIQKKYPERYNDDYRLTCNDKIILTDYFKTYE